MGWFLCKNGSITLPKQIFVPAWGWVGSLCLLLKCANLRGIRPRLGMGWFASMLDGYVLSEKFSSPLGDGLVPTTRRQIGWFLKVFVPAWGWVGSHNSPSDRLVFKGFRPRVGMGWFITTALTAVRKWNFRPRLGMGWFDSIRYLTSNAYCIFVPEWGWVGSKLSEKYNKLLTIFVPVWGWVGSINIKDTIIEHRNFRPRLGLGWFLSDDCRGCQRNEIFVPEWGWVGSENNLHFITTVYEFSSPSGDGLVLQILTEILKNRVIRYRHNKQL